MMRSWISQYYPHALLLIGSVACLTIALGTPQHTYTPNDAQPHRQQSRQASPDQFPTRYGPAKTQSLAEFLRLARIKYQSSQQNQAESQDVSNDVQTPLTLANDDASQHRMIRRQDFVSLPKVSDPFTVPYTEYALVVDPLALHRPDALPTREYLILGYGEVGQDQPQEASSDIEEIAQAPRTPTFVDVLTIFNEGDISDVDLTSPDMRTPLADPITPLRSAVADAPIALVAVKQTASQPTPTPLASKAAPLATSTETKPTTGLRQADQPVVMNQRPASVDTPATTAIPTETKLTGGSQSTIRKDSRPALHEQQDEPTPFKTLVYTDTKPLVRPTVQDTPKPARVSSKTPADTTSKARTEEPKLDSHPHYPGTPDAIVSIKPTQKEHTDHGPEHTDLAPQNPVKTISKPVSKTTNPLVVLIDDYNSIGADRLNAIDNALSRINQAAKKAEIDIELKVTTDKFADHNILFREDDGKDLGNVLGLAQFAVTEDSHGNEIFLGEDSFASGGKARIDINNSFNWFAGDDEDEIDDDQFDYQTAVEHEFLHLLGIDDDFDDLEAVSHGLLNPGEIRREIDNHEIDELAGLFASNNPWQSQYNPSSWSRNNKGKVRYKSKALTAVVPEPASAAMIGVGVVVGVVRWRR